MTQYGPNVKTDWAVSFPTFSESQIYALKQGPKEQDALFFIKTMTNQNSLEIICTQAQMICTCHK